MQATSAPSRANKTDIARPFPTGGSSSTIVRCPAPTMMMRRPLSRPWLLAWPSVSACNDADGSICFGACVVVDMVGSPSHVIPGRAEREPGISRFPDVQLHICGLVLRTIPE
jgi:hypothetical protein